MKAKMGKNYLPMSDKKHVETDISLLNAETRSFIESRLQPFRGHPELRDMVQLAQAVMVNVAFTKAGEIDHVLFRAMISAGLNTFFVGAALANPGDRDLIRRVLKENIALFGLADEKQLREIFEYTDPRSIGARVQDTKNTCAVEIDRSYTRKGDYEDFADIDRYVGSLPTQQIRAKNDPVAERERQFRSYLENEYGKMIDDVVKTFGDFDLEDGIVVEKGLPLREEIMNALTTLPLACAIKPEVIKEVMMVILADRYGEKYGKIIFGITTEDEKISKREPTN